jgi:DNA invertase Pin-like site-specific DNA recombinase
MRAIGYCRVSTGKQEDSGAGLEAQEAHLRREATHRGWDLILVTDVASGKAMGNRAELGKALRQLRDHDMDVLVVTKLDRLSRSVADFANIMALAAREGWAIVVLDLGVDMTTPNGKMIAQIMMALAEWERELIGLRTRDALQAVRARGTRLGRPRGVTPETLRLIRVMRAGGNGWRGIATALTAEGVPTAQGGQWHAATVKKLHERVD